MNIPSWKQFAWAAFIYHSIGGDKEYVRLMQDEELLQNLRQNPNNVAIEIIRESIIKGFLNKWRSRVVNSPDSAYNLQQALNAMVDYLSPIRDHKIVNVNFSEQIQFNDQQRTVAHIIKFCYDRLRNLGYRFGPTATCKLLHVLNPNLFVMWDNPILGHFKEHVNNDITDSGEGYVEYLKAMQKVAKEVVRNFQEVREKLKPQALPNQGIEDYLSTQLQYPIQKSLAKYLDEYHWVTITNEVDLPPQWHP